MKWSQLRNRAKRTEGQSLIEFALSLPMIFLLIVNLVNFGGFFYAWITVENAARAGANYAILSGVSVGAPATPTGTQLVNLITADMSSLPNTPTVLACQVNASATPVTTSKFTGSGSCATTTYDPEYSNYVLTYVDISYNYTPIISLYSFPKLGVYMTIPPTTIRQVAYMRSIQ